MKMNKIILVAFAALVMASCEKEVFPEGSNITIGQLQAINQADSSRAEAAFSGMFTKMGKPLTVFGTSGDRPDDWGFAMFAFSGDIEGADAFISDNDYNWFSVCGKLSSRNANYANPYIRYAAPYNTIADANDVIKQFPLDSVKLAQARALRAYSYICLAPFYQGRYAECADKPCVPIVTDTTVNFTQNPRASVKAVYDFVLEDLDYAVKILDNPKVPARSVKSYIDKSVAHGLRARARLAIQDYKGALEDAVAAADGYTPLSIEECGKPGFMDIAEHNWIWGIDMTVSLAQIEKYATSSSWLRSFSGESYSCACQCYTCINTLLYDQIPADDVRKGWWVDENLSSPLLDDLTWGTAAGADIPYLEITDVKMAFLPYTNVKFGCLTCGTTTNEEDFPLMRVEEMILIQAECQLALGETQKAQDILTNFLTTYRNPSYTYDAKRSLADEIWFQRRVELWGEGFYSPDQRRLNKPVVRTHGIGTTNVSENFAFNMAYDDPWMLMRFPDTETNTNFAIIDNKGGSLPVANQNADLRDGVTD